MEKYEIKIFPLAEQDLRDIIDYLNELSPQAAFKTYDEIIDEISTLAHTPMRCPLVKNIVLRAKGYRMLVIHNFAVFYVVIGKTVQIRRILYKKRQYEILLGVKDINF